MKTSPSPLFSDAKHNAFICMPLRSALVVAALLHISIIAMGSELRGQVAVNLSIAPDPADLSEMGETATISACLEGGATAGMNLGVVLAVAGTAGSDDHNLFNGSEITIPDGQTCGDITLTPFDDDFDEPNESVVISISSLPNGFFAGAESEVVATIIDNDMAQVTFTPTDGLITTEAGGSDTFTVVLGSEPTDPVTIEFFPSDPSEGTVNPIQVSFNPLDWDSAILVTVTGVDDTEMDGDVLWWLGSTVQSSDPNYANLTTPDIEVTNEDNDFPDLIFSDRFLTP